MIFVNNNHRKRKLEENRFKIPFYFYEKADIM